MRTDGGTPLCSERRGVRLNGKADDRQCFYECEDHVEEMNVSKGESYGKGRQSQRCKLSGDEEKIKMSEERKTKGYLAKNEDVNAKRECLPT